MDRKHPKRKKDKLNTYTLKITDQNEYILSFIDGENITHTLKIDEQIYDLFNSFELNDIAYLNEMSRHYEHSILSEYEINNRMLHETETLEDKVIRNIEYAELYKAISELPEIQHRRIVLYYFYNLTYEQIAKIDNCSKQAVKFSIDTALAKLRKKLKK